jgi:pantetheine-phosphate adenylyltransferase
MIALYAGSFDPPHLGHIELVRRAAAVSTRLIVGVAVNPAKTPFLPAEVRVALLRAACADLPQLTVETYAGATVAFARARGVQVLIRGLRTAVDAEFERGLAAVNRQAGGIETLLLLADGAHSHLSSSLVREAARAGLPLASLVPPAVAEAIGRHAPAA